MSAPQSRRNPRQIARAIFDAAVDAVRPFNVLCRPKLDGIVEAAAEATNVLVVGGGKAGAGMVIALELLLSDFLPKVKGIVNVPDDLVRPMQVIRLHPSRPMGLNEPTFDAAEGTANMIDLVDQASPNDIVIVLLSGGGSALLVSPAPDVPLTDKVVVTRILSAAGATIHELNCVRKHLSRIKGGQLAIAAQRAKAIYALIISDVVGDAIDVIASGPTVADPTTFSQAFQVLEKYHLVEKSPTSIIHRLKSGMQCRIAETPKSLPANVQNLVIARNIDALCAAQTIAESCGYQVKSLGSDVTGDVRIVAQFIASQVRQVRYQSMPMCLLFGGESTVALGAENGKGGRNQELALALGCELGGDELEGVTLLCCGTDGEDGPTDAAGAIVDRDLWLEAFGRDIDANSYLLRHDSYNFFQPLNGLIQTGLTGTNVGDIGIVLVDHS